VTDFEPDLDVRWAHGVAHKGDDPGPPIQVHRVDDHTYVLRQSKAVHYEAPFLYLLFGNERAILFDTGATADPSAFPLRSVVDGVVGRWLEAHPRSDYGLVVAHTHAHGDHVAADGQFADRPQTVVVGTDLPAVEAFFGFTDWPNDVVSLDLGGRVLEVLPIPGHQETSIAVFDPWTRFLLTGDTVYPGRLYGRDMPAFVESMDRLAEFARQRPIGHVMGCHVEMSRTPRVDYPIGSRYQPHEAPLPMTMQQLIAVRDATRLSADTPGVHVFDDFIVVNGTGARANLQLIARTIRQRVLGRLPR
jgi:hydroxyacylglutathione hydrolase